MTSSRRSTVFVCAALAAAIAVSGTPSATASHGGSGFKTGQDPMLTSVMAGVRITPLLTVGDVLPSGFRFEAVPDGTRPCEPPWVGRDRGYGRVEIFVNHETSKVPFPYNTAATDRGERGERLRQRAGEQADPQSALGWRAQRLVRHLERFWLSAILLQFPRHQEGRVQPGHPVHERGVSGLFLAAGSILAPRAR